jgi:hypothetical protein
LHEFRTFGVALDLDGGPRRTTFNHASF